jgi:hypothetical protein
MKDLTVTDNKIGITQDQWNLIGATTPKDKIKQRPGRGGKTFDYVETGYIVNLLNTTFNGLWDFEIDEQEVGQTQVWVKGKLTVWINPELKITKTQFGGSDIKKTQEGKPVDVADDLKSASSDCLKKCASLLGFASDIYWKEKESPQSGVKSRENTNASASEYVGVGKPTEKQINYINVLASEKGIDREELKLEYKVDSMKDLSYDQVQEIIKKLMAMPSKGSDF